MNTTPEYSDLDLEHIASDLRSEDDVMYIIKVLRSMRTRYENKIAALQPAPARVIDYTTPVVLVQRGEASEQGWWNE